MKFFSALIVLLYAMLTYAAYADDVVTAAHVTSGDTLTLSDNHEIRLDAIKVPAYGKLADQSRDALTALLGQRSLTLENPVTDRYGRTQADVYVAVDKGKPLSVEAEMLKSGMAFIYPPTGTEPDLATLFAIESKARAMHLGIWADRNYADLTPEQATQHKGAFGFVSGKILKAEHVKNKTYLNFGSNWKTDFTIMIAAHDLHNFKKAGIDPLDYEGKTVRVRGWVKHEFGPMITVTHPAQIEILH